MTLTALPRAGWPDEPLPLPPEPENADAAGRNSAGVVHAPEHSVLGLAELLLKQPAQVDRLCRDEARQAELIPRFLTIALVSFAAFALALVLLLDLVPAAALPDFLRSQWSSESLGPALSLAFAYTLGLVAATGICLPAFYFYTLLAGVKTSMVQVTTIVLKGKASTGILLIGILPIYVAAVLGLIVFDAPAHELQTPLYIGLVLPFLAGLAGVYAIYQGFSGLADTLPERCRGHRACFLRRLTVSMAACYTAVTPVMIYTLWQYFVVRI
jgi:hypothetical protein